MTTERREPWRYWLFAVFVSMIGVMVASILYANYVSHRASADVARQSTRQVQVFCALFTTLDTGFAASPPTSASGKLLRVEIHQLVAQLHCPP